MADIDHNCMKRCDSWEMCMASLLLCSDELAEAYGGMNGVESLCASIGLESGFGDLHNYEGVMLFGCSTSNL